MPLTLIWTLNMDFDYDSNLVILKDSMLVQGVLHYGTPGSQILILTQTLN